MNSNPNVPYASDFQSVLNYLINFIRPEERRPDKKALAVEMEIKTDTLQRHCNGTIRSDADFARNIIAAFAKLNPDISAELIGFFIPSGFQVVREDHIKRTPGGDLHEQQLDLSRITGRIQEMVKAAMADRYFDRNEKRAIGRKIAALKQAATELNELIQRGEAQ